MRKLFMLVGIAAAVYSARKIFSGKAVEPEQTWAMPPHNSPGYTPQPQG